ncbi:hypothetical protein OpiT1DRAFT_01764 [Opitutaceae bacterium TAV1]|nr:hypothetical protein OpiT1DRAFT_01764 [Opitutaceae bacterium TAV1]
MKQRKTFAELYCEDRQIGPEAYEEAVIRETLHPPGRLLYPVIKRLRGDFFAPDHDLARAAGRLRRMRDFPMQAWEYGHHPRNCGFLRRVIGVRISVGLFREVMRRTIHARLARVPGQGSDSETPSDGTIARFIMGPAASGLAPRDRPRS